MRGATTPMFLPAGPGMTPQSQSPSAKLQPAPSVNGAHVDLYRPEDELVRLRRELAQAYRELALARTELLEARHAARSDALTGLPNRRAFDSASARALAGHEAAPGLLALMFVDLDGFKAINDRLGHTVGDQLLQKVGARLSHGVRRGDLVCRHGGDEFLCLLPALRNRTRAQAIARTLVCLISAPCQVGPHTVRIHASIGVALYPHDGATMAELLRRADEAMYSAKSRGCGVAMAALARHSDGSLPCSCP
jgi:diguanylate cyclase (GGDEF)-like protein